MLFPHAPKQSYKAIALFRHNLSFVRACWLSNANPYYLYAPRKLSGRSFLWSYAGQSEADWGCFQQEDKSSNKIRKWTAAKPVPVTGSTRKRWTIHMETPQQWKCPTTPSTLLYQPIAREMLSKSLHSVNGNLTGARKNRKCRSILSHWTVS